MLCACLFLDASFFSNRRFLYASFGIFRKFGFADYSSDYSVAYAIADSPFGPFERIGKILQQDESVGTGAGHHSVIQIPGKDEWYIVYHRHPLGDTIPNHREICIDRMYFDENGFIKPVKMTFDGVGVNRLTD